MIKTVHKTLPGGGGGPGGGWLEGCRGGWGPGVGGVGVVGVRGVGGYLVVGVQFGWWGSRGGWVGKIGDWNILIWHIESLPVCYIIDLEGG